MAKTPTTPPSTPDPAKRTDSGVRIPSLPDEWSILRIEVSDGHGSHVSLTKDGALPGYLIETVAPTIDKRTLRVEGAHEGAKALGKGARVLHDIAAAEEKARKVREESLSSIGAPKTVDPEGEA